MPETVSTKTKLRESAAVEVLEEKEGSHYIVLYIQFRQDVFEPPVGPKNNFENRKNQEKDKLKKRDKNHLTRKYSWTIQSTLSQSMLDFT